MNNKLLALLAVTLVLIGAAWKISVDKAPQTEVVRTALTAGLLDHVNEVTRIELKSGKNATTLKRTGDAWTVANKDDFPADAAAIRRTLLQLADLQVVEAKTSLPESYARIGVADPGEGSDGMLVELYDAQDRKLLGLIVGHEREGGHQEQRYVRRAGEAQSFLVNGKVEGQADPITWLDARIVDVDTARVRQVEIVPADGPAILISKAKPEENFFELQNVPAGKAPRSKALVSSLGAVLLDLRFNSVAAASRVQNGKALRKTTVTTFDGLVAGLEEIEADGKTWARFTFSYDATHASAPAKPAAAPDAGTDGKPATPEAQPKETVEQEARRLAEKTANWVYELPDYKLRMLGKRLEDLVQDADKAGAGRGK